MIGTDFLRASSCNMHGVSRLTRIVKIEINSPSALLYRQLGGVARSQTVCIVEIV